MTDVGYDGVLDVPDDVHGRTARCPACGTALTPDDDDDCGRDGCPVETNAETLRELRRP